MGERTSCSGRLLAACAAATNGGPPGFGPASLYDEGLLVFRQVDAERGDHDCTEVLLLRALDQCDPVVIAPGHERAQVGAALDLGFGVGRFVGGDQLAVDELEAALLLRQLLLANQQFEVACVARLSAVDLDQDLGAAVDLGVERVVRLAGAGVFAPCGLFGDRDVDHRMRMHDLAVLGTVFVNFGISDFVVSHERLPCCNSCRICSYYCTKYT